MSWRDILGPSAAVPECPHCGGGLGADDWGARIVIDLCSGDVIDGVALVCPDCGEIHDGGDWLASKIARVKIEHR